MTRTTNIADCVLYDKNGAIVVDKPAGIPSTGRNAEDPNCVQFMLAEHFRRKIWAVHQLDTGTTGVNVFVSKKSLVSRWVERMKPPRGRKTYLSICYGKPENKEFKINMPIGPLGSRYEIGVTSLGKPALSRVRLINSTNEHSLVEIVLMTGRTHQVRIHLSHVGLPLVGEQRYIEKPCTLASYPALHARNLDFSDKESPKGFEAPVPGNFRSVALSLGLDLPTNSINS